MGVGKFKGTFSPFSVEGVRIKLGRGTGESGEKTGRGSTCIIAPKIGVGGDGEFGRDTFSAFPMTASSISNSVMVKSSISFAMRSASFHASSSSASSCSIRPRASKRSDVRRA